MRHASLKQTATGPFGMGHGLNLVLHDDEIEQLEARLAISLVDRWGMVAGVPNGEDSSGQAKGRLMTVDELTDRAVATAEILIAKLRTRGHITKGVSIGDLNEATK